jgi:hypothetical protein
MIGAAFSFSETQILSESGASMGRSYRDADFSDMSEQLTPEFYDNAEAIADVEDVPASHLTLSDEARAEEIVDVRFDGDGFAEEVSEEDSDEEVKTAAKAKPVEEEPLEPMPLMDSASAATGWGSAFTEIHSRAQSLGNKSKVTAIRYANCGRDKKVSSLPSVVDLLADIQIVARRSLSPDLYKIWLAIYYEGYGENERRLPLETRMHIQERCGTGWIRAGLLPFGKYWHRRTSTKDIQKNVAAMEADAKRVPSREYQKKRRASLKQKRTITTLKTTA